MFDSINKVLDKYKKGDHQGIRWLTNLDAKEDFKVAKAYMDLGMQIRHLENMSVSILLADKDFNLIDSMKDGNIYSLELISNIHSYIKLFALLFEYLWKNGIDAYSLFFPPLSSIPTSLT